MSQAAPSRGLNSPREPRHGGASAPPATHLRHRSRLRERFRESGLGRFADYEVLELLLTFGQPRVDTKPAAKALDKAFGGLAGVLDAELSELEAVEGVGPQGAVLLKVLRESMERYFLREAELGDAVASPEAVVRWCRAALEGEKNEVFLVLHLSTKNRVLGHERLAEGSIDRAAVYPRRVIESAFRANAAALILVHNHPSGDPSPSPEDRQLTRELSAAARPLGLKVHDHLVIGKGRHFSFRAAGWMDASA